MGQEGIGQEIDDFAHVIFHDTVSGARGAGDQGGAIPRSRSDVLASLDDPGLLPDDIRDRLRS